MTIIRVRLDEQDRKQYGGDDGPLPEDLTLDTERLKDLPAGEIDALEMTLDAALAGLLRAVEPQLTQVSRIRRAVAYLAVRQAGRDVDYGTFQPRLLRAEFTQEVTEEGPPAGPSERSSED